MANSVIEWVQNNQQLIVTIFQWVATVGAFGAALFAVGSTISIVGSAMTVLSTIGTALAAVFAAITSPIGLVVAAVVGLGVVLSQNSEVVSAFQIMVSTAWDAIKSVTLTVWNAISGTVLGVWNAITSAAATALNWLQQAVITAFSAVTFAITEWKSLLYTAMISAALAVVRFGEQLKWVFTEVIPTTVLWLYNNWRDIFTDLVNMVATVAGNIWTNLVNLKDAIAGWFSGEGFDFKWTGLTDGFESSIKELPKILQREKGPLEQALERELGDIVMDVGQKWDAHNSKFRKQIAPKAKASPAEAAPAAPTQQELDRQKKLDAAGGAGLAGLAAAGGAEKEIFATFSAQALAAQGGGAGTQEKIAKKLEDRDRKQTRWEEQMLATLNGAFQAT